MIVIRAISIVAICLLHAIPAFCRDQRPIKNQAAPRPLPSAVMTEAGLRLELQFASLEQGGVGLLRLSGGEIKSAHALFMGRRYAFARLDDAWYALLPARMDAYPRRHDLTVTAFRYAGQVRFERQIPVAAAFYIKQEFDMPRERAWLVDAELEDAEFARLRGIMSGFTGRALWDGFGFGLPLESETTSPFGAFRLMNGRHETRHTGWDQRAASGADVHSVAAGKVVFAGALEIRGGSVVIDHGLGLYSLYAHLSEALVEAGDTVGAAQVIGKSGDTGRSSGAHLHWEIVVGGYWVDGLALARMWLPA